MKTAIVLAGALAFAAPTWARAAEPTTSEQAGERGKQAQTAADGAYQAYQSGDFAKAIALYLESYKLAPTADVLFNVASIYDKKLQDSKLAIEFYRRCSSSPDASPDLVSRSTSRVAALSAQAQEAQPPPAAPAPPAAKREAAAEDGGDPGKTMRVAGLVTAGAGVVGLAVGTVFGLTAKSKHGDATSAGCANGVCPDATSASTERDAGSAATVSTIGFVAGGVLLAGGVAMVLLAPARKDEPAPAVSSVRVGPAVGPGAVGLSVSGILF